MTWTRVRLDHMGHIHEDVPSGSVHAMYEMPPGLLTWIWLPQPEVLQWLNDMVESQWLFYLNCDAQASSFQSAWLEMAFIDPAMALLFKLTWGGR